MRAKTLPPSEQKISEVLPGGVLSLTTGKLVKLSGVLLPQYPLSARQKARAIRARLALKTLRELTVGQNVGFAGIALRDRHGRALAQVFLGAKTWLQSELVARGLARVEPETPGSVCVTHLLSREAEARERGAGFWAEPDFQIYPAWKTRRLRRLENTFQIVSGKVAKVAKTKRFVYLNFGTDWRNDFTASVKARTAERFAKAGVKLSHLEGRKIRVRGWITYRNGPMIEVTRAEQIEPVGKQKGPEQ